MTKQAIMDFFPLPNPRKNQIEILNKIQNIITQENKRFILLEAPVGSGKSAIAITVAQWLGQTHILTPLKSLQNQYYHDFAKHVTLMKGRNAYPCTYEKGNKVIHEKVLQDIYNRKIIWLEPEDRTCAEGLCKDDKAALRDCQEEMGECPYHAAINTAKNFPIIVHNFHSFIFQTHFTERFDIRDLLIIDEAHITENLLRDFSSKKITMPRQLTAEEEPEQFETLNEWIEFFLKDTFLPNKQIYTSKEKAYLDQIEKLQMSADRDSWEKFIVKRHDNVRPPYTKFEFVPESIGSLAHSLIFNYGKQILMMSGTIYSKAQFCRNLGIKESEVSFIRTDSSFPEESRPIYLKSDYMHTTSHAGWKDNLPKIAETCNTLLEKFHDVKGLIHVPSYMAGTELQNAMKNKRLVSHGQMDFQKSIEHFYKSKGNKVFISPICQQGVDFKEDRARFQLILRIPYLNTGDAFIERKVKTDFPWYNYHALVVFGQQIGRINRSETDFGVTILMDDRFPDFIRRNNNVLPKWLTRAIIRN